MAVTGIGANGDFSNYYTAATNASTEAFQNTLNSVSNKSTEAELLNACKEFEAYFIEQMYKSMEKTVMSSEDEESSSISQYKELFGSMQTQEYAKQATDQGGIGLAQELYQQMKRNYGL